MSNWNLEVIYFDDFEFIKVKSGKGQTILFDTDGGNFIEPLVGEQGERFLDNQRIEGNIPEMLDGAIQFARL